MNKIKILFVEDDPSFAFVVAGSLELTGMYEVCTVSNGKKGLEAYESFAPDVIVSDIEMPVLDGMEMVRQIRERNNFIPILFATGRTSAQDVLDGYKLNVDNFIKKPFLPEELDAHIQAILRRAKDISLLISNEKTVTLGEECTFSISTQKIYHKTRGTVRLTPKEAHVLWKLCEKKNEIITRKDLLKDLWSFDDFFTSRSLDVFISSLRKHLTIEPQVRIETIRGVGLKLIVP